MQAEPTLIAVVDDEQTMLRAIERLLAAHGFATQPFASAEAFLASSAAKDAACLVLDINLAGMSGVELWRRLRAAGSELPVIFITAADESTVRRVSAALGGAVCLRKPFLASLLVGAVQSATA